MTLGLGRAGVLVGAALLAMLGCGESADSDPVITALSPARAQAGDVVRIVGHGFGCDPAAGFVAVGPASGTTASEAVAVSAWDVREISFVVPPVTPGAHLVVVTVTGVPSNAAPLDVLP